MTDYFKTAIGILAHKKIYSNKYVSDEYIFEIDGIRCVAPATYSVWKRLTDTELIKELFR